MAELVFRVPVLLALVKADGSVVNISVATLAELQVVRDKMRAEELKNLPDTSLELQLWLALAAATDFLVEV